MSLRDDLLNADTEAERAAVLDAALVTINAALAVLTGLSSGELAVLDGVTAGTQAAGKAVIANAQVNIGVVKATALHVGTSGSETQITATAAEINAQCAVASIGQTITVSGAVTAGKQSVLLNHATVAIAATIADASQHFGYFVIKAGLEPDVANDHTCTITTGTWDGVNKIATFADVDDALVVFFDHAGNGTIINNTGAVALS